MGLSVALWRLFVSVVCLYLFAVFLPVLPALVAVFSLIDANKKKDGHFLPASLVAVSFSVSFTGSVGLFHSFR